jgi:hypothetical protein
VQLFTLEIETGPIYKVPNCVMHLCRYYSCTVFGKKEFTVLVENPEWDRRRRSRRRQAQHVANITLGRGFGLLDIH